MCAVYMDMYASMHTFLLKKKKIRISFSIYTRVNIIMQFSYTPFIVRIKTFT
jgi:hypothetical protein